MHGEDLEICGFKDLETNKIFWISQNGLTENKQEAICYSCHKQKGNHAISAFRKKYTHLKRWKIVREKVN